MTMVQQDYHNLCYHLSSGNAEDLRLRLEKGLLDFCVLMDPFDKRDFNYIELPGKDVWGLLMRKDSLLVSHERITAAELKDLPLLVSQQEEQSAEGLKKWLKGRELNIVGTYNLLYNTTLMVEEGMGYALTLDKLAPTGNDSVLCFKLLYPAVETSSYFG